LSPSLASSAVSTVSSPSESRFQPAPRAFRQVIPLEDARPGLRLVPFRSGARPGHEVLAPGEGCSQNIGLFDSRSAPEQDGGALWLLYTLHPGLGRHRVKEPVRVRMSVWLLPDSPEDGHPLALPGLLCHEVPLCQPSCAISSQLMPAEPGVSQGRYVVELPYAAVRKGLERLGAEAADAFSLAHLFHRRFEVRLELCAGNEVLSCDSTQVELYDLGRFGSLYQRVLEQLVRPDTEAQRERLEARGLSVAHHPWFPVLTIGMDKARLYMEAIESDVSRHTTHLPDPRWLVRVGLFLELRNVDTAFPELRALPARWRQWLLWRECGDFEALGLGRVPGWLSRCVGDQDGLFASASREYRRSMNEVAHRARERGWMDYAGGECVPREASLIESCLGDRSVLPAPGHVRLA
jgi:hypothetical protein